MPCSSTTFKNISIETLCEQGASSVYPNITAIRYGKRYELGESFPRYDNLRTYQDANGYNLETSDLFPENQKTSFQKFRTSFLKISGSEVRTAGVLNMFDGKTEFEEFSLKLTETMTTAGDGDVFMFQFTSRNFKNDGFKSDFKTFRNKIDWINNFLNTENANVLDSDEIPQETHINQAFSKLNSTRVRRSSEPIIYEPKVSNSGTMFYAACSETEVIINCGRFSAFSESLNTCYCEETDEMDKSRCDNINFRPLCVENVDSFESFYTQCIFDSTNPLQPFECIFEPESENYYENVVFDSLKSETMQTLGLERSKIAVSFDSLNSNDISKLVMIPIWNRVERDIIDPDTGFLKNVYWGVADSAIIIPPNYEYTGYAIDKSCHTSKNGKYCIHGLTIEFYFNIQEEPEENDVFYSFGNLHEMEGCPGVYLGFNDGFYEVVFSNGAEKYEFRASRQLKLRRWYHLIFVYAFSQNEDSNFEDLPLILLNGRPDFLLKTRTVISVEESVYTNCNPILKFGGSFSVAFDDYFQYPSSNRMTEILGKMAERKRTVAFGSEASDSILSQAPCETDRENMKCGKVLETSIDVFSETVILSQPSSFTFFGRLIVTERLINRCLIESHQNLVLLTNFDQSEAITGVNFEYNLSQNCTTIELALLNSNSEKYVISTIEVHEHVASDPSGYSTRSFNLFLRYTYSLSAVDSILGSQVARKILEDKGVEPAKQSVRLIAFFDNSDYPEGLRIWLIFSRQGVICVTKREKRPEMEVCRLVTTFMLFLAIIGYFMLIFVVQNF